MLNAFLITLEDNKRYYFGIIGLCIWAVIDINATYKKYRKEFEVKDENTRIKTRHKFL